MRHFKTFALLLVGGCLVGVAAQGGAQFGPQASALNAGSAGPNDCVKWSTEAKALGYAFDHYVTLESACGMSVRCDITTSTKPEATQATVPAGESKQVLIWRGSPARELSAEVTCQPAR